MRTKYHHVKTSSPKTKHASSPLACNLSALTAPERIQHEQNGNKIFHAVQEVKELSDGYAFRLLADTSMLLSVAEFVEKEQLCCPFFHFVIDVGPENGSLWVSMTGPEGVKPFMVEEFSLKELMK
ncbi:MAG: hypothetical protein HY033_06980 [Ignavibacteriae bacterium]|nr:hypothetical protein [Ignavibacteria bacterium]MBI3364636.1 hypothetical protein [Ignavibacteriota bacterium]